MPIKILDTQRRARELGRIRLGDKGDRGQPQKLNRFRLTTQAKELLETAASLYGGEVREWTPRGGVQQWELYTTARRIPIIVPPQPVSQWLEYWGGGGCLHRCDGETNMLTGEPCDLDETITVRVRGNDVQINPHQEAKPTTRLKVILRDVEGVGVWRLESHGWNAAVELPDAADFLAQAGGYIEGHLALEERKTISDGQTNRFVVPIIEIDVTPAELFAGKGRIVPAIAGGPVPQTPAQEDAPAALSAAQPSAGVTLPTLDDIEAAADIDTLTAMRADLVAAKALTQELDAATVARRDQLLLSGVPKGEPVDAEVVDDPEAEAAAADQAWNRCLKAAGQLDPPMSTSEVVADFEKQHGKPVSGGTSAELAAYAGQLEGAKP